MKVSFHGGAGEVTGSRFLVETGGKKILLDCGLFQGHRREAIEKNLNFKFKPAELAGVLLTHAHVDHSGALPMLTQRGYLGPIECTPPTLDLCQIMLQDCGRLQEDDAAFYNKINAKTGHKIEPLYTEDDALKTMRQFRGIEYMIPFPVAGGAAQATLLNAGHILGSAMVLIEAEGKRLLYTGDVGRSRTLLMEQVVPPPGGCDALIIETTYGGGKHDDIGMVEEQLWEAVNVAVREKGKILIASFALERTQELVFLLEKLKRDKAIPDIPVVVDSPMAVDITKIFNKHLGSFSFDDEFNAYVAKEGDPFGIRTVKYVRTVDESKALNEQKGPMIVIAASGMCEGGRILHHLRNSIGDPTTTLLLAGYQAEGTLGRRLHDGARKVRIFGQEHDVAARVKGLHTLSAHADSADLMKFIQGLDPKPKHVFLVHGENVGREAFSAALKAAGIQGVLTPMMGDAFDVSAGVPVGPK